MDFLDAVGVGMDIRTGYSVINVQAIEDGGGGLMIFLLEIFNQQQCSITSY